ncbi:carbonic anhydrase [Xylariomycetidae sp. FL2044]|nr:carbonic anhydrase [Xylariomycetidae sp. FL2044]
MASFIASTLVLAASVTPAWAFCGAHTHLDRRAEGEVPISTFGYSGTIGPVAWSQLDPANALCSTGTTQSPIDMVEGQFTEVPATDIQLSINDALEGAIFENLGTTIEVVMEAVGGSMVLDGVNFTLQQFHFHHPSEHLAAGVSLPMEMHMVFGGNEAEEVAVIGTYIDLADVEPMIVELHLSPRATSTLLETIFTSVGEIAEPGTETTTQPLIFSELVTFLTEGNNFQRYTGSLTTPPCSEGVQWLVSTSKLQLSRATFQTVRDTIGFNSRFPQNTLGSGNILALASGQPAAEAPAEEVVEEPNPSRNPSRSLSQNLLQFDESVDQGSFKDSRDPH